MKAMITQYKKMALVAVITAGMIAPLGLIAKGLPTQLKKRNQAVANADSDPAKCKPCQQARTTRDEMAAAIAQGRSAAKLGLDPATDMVQACCEFCAMPDSLGCQGENRARCAVCQQGLLKISIAEAAAAALALAAILAKEDELDTTPTDSSRAPREELVDPCGPCGPADCEAIDSCRINAQLCALQKCCCMVNNRLQCQGEEARKCCKRMVRKIENVEDLVESVIDQSADCCSLTETLLISVIDQSTECCSVIDTRLGDLGGSVLDIPLCQFGSIVDVVNSIDDADIVTWLKSIYALLYEVHSCTCCIAG